MTSLYSFNDLSAQLLIEDVVMLIEEYSTGDRIIFYLVQFFDLIVISDTIGRGTMTADISLALDVDADTNVDPNRSNSFLLNDTSIFTWFSSNLS